MQARGLSLRNNQTVRCLSNSHCLTPLPPLPARAQGICSVRSTYSNVSCAPTPRRGVSCTRRHFLGLAGASASVLSPSSIALNAYAGSSSDDEAKTMERTYTPLPIDPPTYVTATGRIVAIGDLHGDLEKAVESLKVARCIDVQADGEVVWIGGDTVVVQLGDVLDRGNVEIGILNLLRFLDTEARKQGGAVYMLNGNHESLNICGDFRYVTPGAFAESALYGGLSEADLKDWQMVAMVRYHLYKPGGELAKELAKNPTVLIVNDTAFAHGGLLPTHVQYGIEKLNSEVAAWMRGDKQPDGKDAPPPMIAIGTANSVMWNRTLSKESFTNPSERYHACRALTQALEKVHAKRLVVGHTPQLTGANCECDNQVWRIDVGMSYGVLNRPVQAIEISKDDAGETQVRVLRPLVGSDELAQLQVAADL